MKIEDNFLDQKEFDALQTLMMSSVFDWHYNDDIVFRHEDSEEEYKYQFQFTHMFFAGAPCSSYIEKLEPVIKIINPISLWRIKANLLTRTPEIIENEFHIDMDIMSEEKLKHWTTSIFYINTNNGYTEFEDGTKVESVTNRMVTFQGNMKHRGTSCTDEKRRIVINFNYFTVL